MSNLWPFMKTGGKSWRCLRDMTTCVVFSSLNLTRLSCPHLSTFVKSLVRSEAEVYDMVKYQNRQGVEDWMKKMNLSKRHRQR